MKPKRIFLIIKGIFSSSDNSPGTRVKTGIWLEARIPARTRGNSYSISKPKSTAGLPAFFQKSGLML
jgi:hypothetical protein